jgi:hypothetical protein
MRVTTKERIRVGGVWYEPLKTYTVGRAIGEKLVKENNFEEVRY